MSPPPTSSLKRKSRSGSELTCRVHYNVTEKELYELFSTVGRVEIVRLSFDRSGRSTGKGQVKFGSNKDAERAASELKHKTLYGQKIVFESVQESFLHDSFAPRRQMGRKKEIVSNPFAQRRQIEQKKGIIANPFAQRSEQIKNDDPPPFFD
ncbi:unnamed protein product [Rhizopus stolonifer]